MVDIDMLSIITTHNTCYVVSNLSSATYTRRAIEWFTLLGGAYEIGFFY